MLVAAVIFLLTCSSVERNALLSSLFLPWLRFTPFPFPPPLPVFFGSGGFESVLTGLAAVVRRLAVRRLVQIGGRLPTANQLHQSFVKILSKHLATNKKVSFAFQQKSSTMPMMNPSPTEIVELFTFVEATLVQYATVAGLPRGFGCSCEGTT